MTPQEQFDLFLQMELSGRCLVIVQDLENPMLFTPMSHPIPDDPMNEVYKMLPQGPALADEYYEICDKYNIEIMEVVAADQAPQETHIEP